MPMFGKNTRLASWFRVHADELIFYSPKKAWAFLPLRRFKKSTKKLPNGKKGQLRTKISEKKAFR
jgi:hypothetical protein